LTEIGDTLLVIPGLVPGIHVFIDPQLTNLVLREIA